MEVDVLLGWVFTRDSEQYVEVALAIVGIEGFP